MDVINVVASDDRALKNGFHGVEYDSAQNSFRWTGPSRSFVVSVPLSRTYEHKAILTILGSLSPLNLMNNIHVSIDGTFVDVERIGSDLHHSYQVIVPRIRVNTPTTFEFVVHETVSPSEMGVSSDDRKLGVLFKEITFVPLIDKPQE